MSSNKRENSVTDGAVKQLMDVDKYPEYECSATDSGFLSGTNLTSSDDIKLAPDSGLILDEDEDKFAKQLKSEGSAVVDDEKLYMRFDSGVDVGLSETFSELSLKSGQKLNDLSGSSAACTSTTSKSTTQTIDEPSKPEIVINDGTSESILSKISWEYYFQQDEDGDTPLHLGIIHSFTEAIHSLIRLAPHPCLLDVCNDICQSPLHLAVLTGQPTIVRLLIVAGARQSVRDRYGETALHLACRKGDLDCVEALTKPVTDSEVQALDLKYSGFNHESIDYEQWNYEGETCIHVAALEGHIEILRHLIRLGADINAREGKSGYTALHFASVKRDQRLLEFLLTECASTLKLETTAYSKLTAYQIASDPVVRSTLVAHGAVAIESDSDDSYSEEDSSCSDNENEISYNKSHYKPSTGVPINASA